MSTSDNNPVKSYYNDRVEPILTPADRRSAYTAPLRPLDETQALYLASRNELLQEVERQARELRLLHEVRKMLLGVYDLAEIYQTAVISISSVFGFGLVSVYQLYEDGLHMQAQVGYEEYYETIPVGRGVNGQVAATGRGVLLTDVSKHANYLKASQAVSSEICVPLLGAGHEVLGTLSIESDESRRLDERDYKICQALAEHIAMAVSQAMFYEREKRRLSHLTLLNQVGHNLSLALDTPQIIEGVTQPLRQDLNFYSVNIGLVEGDDLVFRSLSIPGQPEPPREYRWPLDTNSLACHSIRTGELVVCPNVTSEPRYLSIPEMPDTMSEVILPLKSSGLVIGVLDVQSDTYRDFDDDDIILLKTLADQTSIALTNARRFSDIQLQSQELNKTNRALAEANRLKSEFLANVSHELRTPLNSIIGYVDMMQNGFYGEFPTDMGDPLERVYRNGRRLLSLINDVLDLANIEAGRMHLLVEEALTAELISSLEMANRAAAEEKGLTFETLIRPGTPRIIQTDIRRVQQVTGIFLSNAIKFTHMGRIVLSVGPIPNNPHAFSISVSDTGIGIAANEFENIFEEFRQIDGSSTRQYSGTGLGLALARRLVRHMGGKLEVVSEVGKGSTFTATLPILPGEETFVF